ANGEPDCDVHVLRPGLNGGAGRGPSVSRRRSRLAPISSQLNDPAVVAEVAALHEAYEEALIGNDVEKLTGFFWDSPDALRFGVAESLYGAEKILAFRKARPAV